MLPEGGIRRCVVGKLATALPCGPIATASQLPRQHERGRADLLGVERLNRFRIGVLADVGES